MAPKLTTLTPLREELTFFQAQATDDDGRVYITRIAYPPGNSTGNLNQHWINLYQTEKSLFLLRGQAVDYVSDVEDLLHELLQIYLDKKPEQIKLLQKQINDDSADVSSVEKLDFMGRKTLLSSILKKDKSLGGKNGYTILLNSIIVDRNKYAHGKFYFHARDNVTVIQWKAREDGVLKSEYAKINATILQNFADCCLSTHKWLFSLKNSLET